jgi:hypothetical protein
MPENVEKIRKKVGRGAATATNSGKKKRQLRGERHLANTKYKGRVKYPAKDKKVPKRLKNLLDGIPS